MPQNWEGIGTLLRVGCLRVIKPFSRLIFINNSELPRGEVRIMAQR